MENTSSRFRLKDDEVELLIEYRAIKQEANELGLDDKDVKHGWIKSKTSSLFFKNKNYHDETTAKILKIKDEIIESVKKHAPKYERIYIERSNDSHLLVIDIADLHIGKLSTYFETGDEITWYYGHGYAERLRNDPTGENQSGKQNPEHKKCSSCEERHRLMLEQQKQKQEEETENKPPESNTVMHMHQPKVNRSRLFTHVAKNNNKETPVSENSTVEFRSMVVPENKINDTIQDGTI